MLQKAGKYPTVWADIHDIKPEGIWQTPLFGFMFATGTHMNQ
jgi:hypothetical protein